MVGNQSSKILNNKISIVLTRDSFAICADLRFCLWTASLIANKNTPSHVCICQPLPATQHTCCWNMCFPMGLVPTCKRAPCFEISDLVAATTRHDDRYALAYVGLTRNDLSLKGVFPPHMQRVLPDYIFRHCSEFSVLYASWSMLSILGFAWPSKK